MSALVRYVSDVTPVGQVVFSRAFFAIFPVVLIFAWRGELMAAVRTVAPARPPRPRHDQRVRHVLQFRRAGAAADRGCHDDHVRVAADHGGTRGDLPEGACAHLSLERGRGRLCRRARDAVAASRSPATPAPASAAAGSGALFALARAFTNAGSVVQTRRLTDTETTSSIVFYFSLFWAIGGLVTLPFGWIVPTWPQFAALVGLGVLGGTLALACCTESCRFAPASLVAPLDYAALLWAFILGCYFRRIADRDGLAHRRAIVAARAVFVIWRERQLGPERAGRRAPRRARRPGRDQLPVLPIALPNKRSKRRTVQPSSTSGFSAAVPSGAG